MRRDASRDEIAVAYRARAKELHPDARPDDATAPERFARVGEAYRVLSDPGERARYDASLTARPTPAAATPAPTRPSRVSRRAARWMVWGGGALVVLGIVVGGFVFSLQRHDADLRANGVAVVATVVDANGERRLEFTTVSGRVVRATESVKSGEEAPSVGSRVPIHYDRSDPTSIVTDDGHTGRNITLWIVTVKFIVGGTFLIWFGLRRLRRGRDLVD